LSKKCTLEGGARKADARDCGGFLDGVPRMGTRAPALRRTEAFSHPDWLQRSYVLRADMKTSLRNASARERFCATPPPALSERGHVAARVATSETPRLPYSRTSSVSGWRGSSMH
jgi:hypothetical protein